MKKILFLAIAFAIGWFIYNKYIEPRSADMVAESESIKTESGQRYSNNELFKCDGRQHCSQMTSRAEAEFFIRNCPDTKMDGDNDGIPCENDSRF
ncbi:MAG: excalibur calcium-binding domain-containing protein [Proteobacteria bacterium]|nr:excalibur calcium-binding domain-containing protein [Pseudomonadota bacterium]